MNKRFTENFSPVGIGTYGIGGRGHRDMPLTEVDTDETYLNALTYMLKRGINFTELALGYGHENSIRLFKIAFDQSEIKRSDIFITHSLYPRDFSNLDEMNQDIEKFYRIMQTNYADSTLVTQSLILNYGQDKIYKVLHELIAKKKTDYVSLSNASPVWIKKFKDEFGDNFFAHEGHLSFEVRALEEKGVFKLCDQLDVKNIIWRPLGRSSTLNRNWNILEDLAIKYDKSVAQIILNWMNSKNYYPMIFSTNIKHIEDNLRSFDFKLSENEIYTIDNFKPNKNELNEISWETKDIDNDIVGLISNFTK